MVHPSSRIELIRRAHACCQDDPVEAWLLLMRALAAGTHPFEVETVLDEDQRRQLMDAIDSVHSRDVDIKPEQAEAATEGQKRPPK